MICDYGFAMYILRQIIKNQTVNKYVKKLLFVLYIFYEYQGVVYLYINSIYWTLSFESSVLDFKQQNGKIKDR
jgi:hypothetical protein